MALRGYAGLPEHNWKHPGCSAINHRSASQTCFTVLFYSRFYPAWGLRRYSLFLLDLDLKTYFRFDLLISYRESYAAVVLFFSNVNKSEVDYGMKIVVFIYDVFMFFYVYTRRGNNVFRPHMKCVTGEISATCT